MSGLGRVGVARVWFLDALCLGLRDGSRCVSRLLRARGGLEK